MSHVIFPGDFFQIRNGEIIILGNIFRNGVVDPDDVRIDFGIKQNESSWSFSEGVSKPYSGRSYGQNPVDGNFEFSTQKLSLRERGNFIFRGHHPESVKIANWGKIQQSCIIKLTQTLFSFRQLYLVTETASVSDWTLAIAGEHNAELEVATETENFGLVDIFGIQGSKTIQSRGLEYHHRETDRRPHFFKAKKLVIQDEQIDTFINQLVISQSNHYEWAYDFFRLDQSVGHYGNASVPMVAQASILDMLQANQLNPNSALLYFRWGDANLDDIERLFTTYDH